MIEKWISMEQQRPSTNRPVLLLIKANFITVQVVARLIRKKATDVWVLSWNLEPLELDSDDVLYWMPLLEPPQEVNNCAGIVD